VSADRPADPREDAFLGAVDSLLEMDAQLGLLPQMHRDEQQSADSVRRLHAASGRDSAAVANVPNRDLAR
jgi:hypothetical protein